VGAGPPPVDIDSLTTDKIIDALKTLILPTCQTAAKIIQEKMLKEDGIQATVDHLHRTIYGAILAGNTHAWMKRGAERALDSVIEEVERERTKSQLVTRRPSDADGIVPNPSVLDRAPSFRGGLRGFLAMPSVFGGGKKKPSVGSRLNDAASGTSEALPSPSEGGEASASVPAPTDANGRPLRPVEIAEDNLRKQGRSKSGGGFFSILGC
jgi:hypothetical protein